MGMIETFAKLAGRSFAEFRRMAGRKVEEL